MRISYWSSDVCSSDLALPGRGLLVVVAELALEQAVDALDLLLLTQLGGVVGQLAATGVGSAVLAGFLFQLALGVQRTRRALERQVGAFAKGELAGGTDITSHLLSAPQRRSVFGGRHTSSGIGVTTMKLVIERGRGQRWGRGGQ